MTERASARRPIVIAAIVGIVAVLVVGLAVFQPWKLVLNVTVDEAAPQRGSVLSSTDTFQTYEHETTGTVKLVNADGKTFVRLENFATSNGPDVVVYLSPAPATGPEEDFGRDPLHLGPLKGNRGDQNYEVPAGTDLTRYRSVVIWCQRFSVAFGAAPLRSAPV